MRSWCAIALLPVLSFAIVRAQEWQIRGSQVADPPGSILAMEGTPQSAQVGTPFPLQFKVFVRDSLGNPWPFVTVRWTPPLTGPSGTFVGGVYTALTNANGVAVSAGFNANLVAGSYVVRATAAGISDPANFHLTNTAGPPATIIAVAGTPQSTMVNTYFSVRFSVLVRDAAGNPVPSLPVMWQAPATGASGTFDTSEVQGTTHDSGIVTAPPFRANGIAGSYVVQLTQQE